MYFTYFIFGMFGCEIYTVITFQLSLSLCRSFANHFFVTAAPSWCIVETFLKVFAILSTVEYPLINISENILHVMKFPSEV